MARALALRSTSRQFWFVVELPRLPVDGKKVVEHRFTLGAFERTRLDQIAGSYEFKSIANPILGVLKDGTAMASLLLFFTFVFPKWREDPATGESMSDTRLLSVKDDEKGLSDYLEAQNLMGIAAGMALTWLPAVAWGAGPPGWFALGLGALGGTLAVEGTEEVMSDIERAKIAARNQMKVIQLLVGLGAVPEYE